MDINVENVYINYDEITNVIDSLGHLALLKDIQDDIHDGDFSHMESKYNGYPLFRDYEYESYNGIGSSEIGEMFLDAIFKDGYDIFDHFIDDTDQEMLDTIAYNFRISEKCRIDAKDYEDGFESYSVLSLYSDNIRKALTIAENDRDILGEIEKKVNKLTGLYCSELEENAVINLEAKSVEVLYGSISLYHLEEEANDLYSLELHCKGVVEDYEQQ